MILGYAAILQPSGSSTCSTDLDEVRMWVAKMLPGLKHKPASGMHVKLGWTGWGAVVNDDDTPAAFIYEISDTDEQDCLSSIAIHEYFLKQLT